MATLEAAAMSTARQTAWNIQLVDHTTRIFAGVYTRDLRVQDLFAELRFVFDFSFTQDLSLWPEEGQSSTVFFEASPDILDRVIDAPEPDAEAVRIVVAHHDSDACHVPGETDLTPHRQGGCAILVRPKRRQHSFYLPINQKSNDPVVAAFPFRRRRNLSPSKRSQIGSQIGSGSPSRGSESEATETAEHSDVVGPSMLMDVAAQKEARKQQHDFRSVALGISDRCAVTKLGKSWCPIPAVGPGIHVAHIVPQLQYHLYPPEDDDAADIQQQQQQQQQSASVPTDLMVAWNKTWSADNSIVLSASIHEAFDQRLLAIHPDSHKIRVFAPYDLIIPYHGHKANFGRCAPDRNALRWHWNVCVIENMGAKTKLLRQSLILLPRGTETPPSRSHQGDAEDENDDGNDDGDGMGPPSASAGPAGRGVGGDRKRSRLSGLRGECEEDDMPDLSHGEGSSAPSFAESGQGYGSTTKRQRTAAWLDGIPPPFEGPRSAWIPGPSKGR
ncbi:hypothetical protein RB595_010752 [Gaeumannomyces hyphopodioides]